MAKDRPRRHAPIVMSIVAALMLAIAPIPDWAAPFRPDWVTMTLIYWSIAYPSSYSVGSAWLIGIVLDVAQGTLLGQHALALCMVVYVSVKFHLQMRQFPLLQLSATAFALLALYEFILFWINGVAGVAAPARVYWGPVVSGALVWPLVQFALGGINRRART